MGYHVCAERYFDNRIEAQFLQTRNHLSKLCVAKLTGYGRRNDSVHLVVLVAVAILDIVNGVQNVRLVHNGAERTLIYASAALNTLLVVNFRRVVLFNGNCLHLTSDLARAFSINNRCVRAYLRASAALNTFRLVDMRNVVSIKGDSATLTYVLATVRQTATAGSGYFIAACRTFVAGNVNHLDNVVVVLVTTHGNFNTLA